MEITVQEFGTTSHIATIAKSNKKMNACMLVAQLALSTLPRSRATHFQARSFLVKIISHRPT